jgi:hypothetical protein
MKKPHSNVTSTPAPSLTDPPDYYTALAKLREDLSSVNRAIAALERYGTGRGPRRGRPPKWLRRERAGAEF